MFRHEGFLFSWSTTSKLPTLVDSCGREPKLWNQTVERKVKELKKRQQPQIMSMTTFYTTASSAAELAEALLLTSSPCEGASSSSSSSLSVSTSVEDEDMMMLDFDVDDSPLPSCLVNCLAYDDGQGGSYPFDKRSLDLIQGDSQAVTSAVFCFVKKFVW